MGAIEDIYADLDADVSEEEFREAVEQKVEQMGGLADEETAAMLIAHDLGESEVEGIADIEAGMGEAKFVGKVTSVGEVRTFEREDDEDGEGRVLNLTLADETGQVRVALWDEEAAAAAEELEVGQVLRVKGRPKEGYNGLEVSADRVEPDDEVDIDVQTGGATIDSLSLGQSDVDLRGVVLDTESVRTFDRDDGSEGRVANLALGDETGRVRVTLWDERADRAEELDPGTSVEVVDGYVRERDGQLELHVGSRGAVEEVEEAVDFVPEATDIADLELGDTADIAGVVRSADPKRTFDRDDGSEGQVRNVRVQDRTGDIRVALWGEKADTDLGPGDEVFVADVQIEEGWQEDLEGSANWRSTVVVLEGSPGDVGDSDAEAGAPQAAGSTETGTGTASGTGDGGATGLSAFADGETPATDADTDDPAATDAETDAGTGVVEFTGTVVQPGDPVKLDDGEETMTVETTEDVHLGEEVTVRGRMRDGRLDADEVF